MIRSKLLYLFWIAAIVWVVHSFKIHKEETTAFQGIADTREVIINSEKAVEVRAIHVVPGQTVQKGTILVELDRTELTLKINEISNRLKELRSRKSIDKADIKSKIRHLSDKQVAEVSRINREIDRIKTRHKFNREIFSELKSLSRDDRVRHPHTEVEVRLGHLRQEREMVTKNFQSDIRALKEKLSSVKSHEAILIENLENEYELLLKEKESLVILTSINAIIGSIHCKVGEKISPFDPILTVHPKSPSHVTGYINENVYNLASIGDQVKVTALTAGEVKLARGEIVGMGARIVEYPLRLRKRPEFHIWGREVKIRLPDGNEFLLGEKVVIETPARESGNFIARIMAWLRSKTDELTAAATRQNRMENEFTL